jgi:hypothetical protein
MILPREITRTTDGQLNRMRRHEMWRATGGEQLMLFSYFLHLRLLKFTLRYLVYVQATACIKERHHRRSVARHAHSVWYIG